MSQEQEELYETFAKQHQRLEAKEAILRNSTFNSGAWKQRNPGMRDQNIKRLINGVTFARREREKSMDDLERGK